jgi:S1-C subfamily serine protease
MDSSPCTPSVGRTASLGKEPQAGNDNDITPFSPARKDVAIRFEAARLVLCRILPVLRRVPRSSLGRHLALPRQALFLGGGTLSGLGPPVPGLIVRATLEHAVSLDGPTRGAQGHLQHSAAVNPGNSGGPLLNEQGQVVGLVTFKAKLEGVSFAVRVETIRKVFKAPPAWTLRVRTGQEAGRPEREPAAPSRL